MSVGPRLFHMSSMQNTTKKSSFLDSNIVSEIITETTSQIDGTTRVVTTSMTSINVAAYDEDTDNDIDEFEVCPIQVSLQQIYV